ncbi:MAG TPA: hypothetical protein VGK87_09735, partial [Anaerolineae bacterium]
MIVAVFQFVANSQATYAQTAAPPLPYAKTVASIIKGMTVNQKVGQLFMVDFMGSDASASSDIADLIMNYHVGGVQLHASNQNIVNGSDGTLHVAELTNKLQAIAAITQTSTTFGATPTPQGLSVAHIYPQGIDFIPLFIATQQEGDGAPNSNITQGVTQIPSELAIGATWHT